jgi:hypothetical protein
VSDDGSASTAPGYPAGTGNPVAERMQALLSRAVEDQISEQRTVGNALAEVRAQVAAVGEGLRGAASGVAVERLRGDLSAVATELRTSTTGLGERFDVLARRLEEQSAAITGAGHGTAELAARIDAVAAEVTAQGAAVDRLSAALTTLAAFPQALASLQKDLAGMHNRLAPLSDVRAAVADLQARGSTAEAVLPELETLSARVEKLASSADVARVRDSVVVSLTERIDAVGGRPSVSPDDLAVALAPLQDRLTTLAAGGPALEQMRALDARLQGLEEGLTALGERLGHVGDAAGGIPAVATDLHRLTEQVDGFGAVTGELGELRTQVLGLSAIGTEVAGLREDVEDLGSRVAGLTIPSTEQIAAAVATRLSDRLVDELAPRVADVVLERVAPLVAKEIGPTVAAQVLDGVQTSSAAAEARLRTHMDEAILTLAEALLRKRRPNRSWAAEVPAEEDDDELGESSALLAAETPTPPAAPAKAATRPEPFAAHEQAAASEPEVFVKAEPVLDEPVDATQAIETVAPTSAPQPADSSPPGPSTTASPAPPVTPQRGKAAAPAAAASTAARTAETQTARPAADPAAHPVATDAAAPEPEPHPSARPAPRLPRNTVLPSESAPRRTPHSVDISVDEDDDGGRRRPWWRPGG